MKKYLLLSAVFFYSTVSPAQSISGSTSVCAGYIYSYTASIPGADTFNWVLPNGWYFLYGQGTDSIVVNCNVNVGSICVSGYDSLGNFVDSVCLLTGWGPGQGWYVSGTQTYQPPCYCNSTWTIQLIPQGSSCPGNCGNGHQNPNVYFAAFNSSWPSPGYLGPVNGGGPYYGPMTIYVYQIDTTFGLMNRILVSGGSCGPVNNTLSIPSDGACPYYYYVPMFQSPDPVCIGDTFNVWVDSSMIGSTYYTYWLSYSPNATLIGSGSSFSASFVLTGASAAISYSSSDYFGCNNYGSYQAINVCTVPTAAFSSSVQTICNNGCVSYFNQSTGAIAYQWLFPGGTPSSSTSVNPPTICYNISGQYDVTLIATNAFGSDTTIYTNFITVAPVPIITTSSSPTICEGQSTALTASGGVTYSWYPSSSLSSSTGSIVTASPNFTTVYTITGTSAGCSGSTTVTVYVNPLPIVTISSPAAICEGQSATLTASGAGFYSWSPTGTLNDSNGAVVYANPTSTTTYIVTGNSLGCASSAQVTLLVNPTPVLSISPSLTICNGSSVQLTVTGANSYAWNPGTYLSSTTDSIVTATPALSTTYTVTGVTSGCSSSAQLAIAVLPMPVLTISSSSTICSGQQTILTASGAQSYLWSPSNTLSSSTDSIVTANPLSSTIYSVTGTSLGCSVSEQVTVTVNPIPVLTVSPSTLICFGNSTALDASGADYYLWSPATSLSSSTDSLVTATPDITTTYLLTGTSLGCSVSTSVTITVDQVIPNLTIDHQAGCTPLQVQFTNISSVTSNSLYRWNFGDGGSSTDINPQHVFILPGTYTVILTAMSLTGCSHAVASPEIIVLPSPQAKFEADPPVTDIRSSIAFKDLSSTAIHSWDWDFGDGNGKSNLKNPVYQYITQDDYPVRLIVTNDKGCMDTTTLTVRVHDIDFEIWIPNSFTPNGDGTNESFGIKGFGEGNFQMIIFDRWGTEVFKTADPHEGWNGKYEGTETLCPDDIYYYLISVMDKEKTEHFYRNKIRLLH